MNCVTDLIGRDPLPWNKYEPNKVRTKIQQVNTCTHEYEMNIKHTKQETHLPAEHKDRDKKHTRR